MSNTDLCDGLKSIDRLLKEKSYIEALSLCDSLVQNNSDFVDLIERKARILKSLGEYDSAFSCLERVIELQPDSPAPHFKKARWLVECGRFKESLCSLERVLDLDSGYFRDSVYFFKSEIYLRLGELDKALKNILLVPDDYELMHIFGYKKRSAQDIASEINTALEQKSRKI